MPLLYQLYVRIRARNAPIRLIIGPEKIPAAFSRPSKWDNHFSQ